MDFILTGNKRRIIVDIPVEPEPLQVEEVITQEVIQPLETEKVKTAYQITSPGNGHVAKITRKLLGSEKDIIQIEFIKVNGSAEDDHWVVFHKTLNPVVTIFQVTGFVSHLHREVAAGKLVLNNMPQYLTWLQGKYKLWATYQSPKYETYRQKNLKESKYETYSDTLVYQSGEEEPELKLAVGFPKGV